MNFVSFFRRPDSKTSFVLQFLIVFGTELETILAQQEAIWANIGNFGATLELLGSILGDPEIILGLP